MIVVCILILIKISLYKATFEIYLLLLLSQRKHYKTTIILKFTFTVKASGDDRKSNVLITTFIEIEDVKYNVQEDFQKT